MAILSEYVPCGWGIFWRDREFEYSALRTSESEALKFVERTGTPLAVVEQVYRRREKRE
jgi:hypothetical protein